MTAKSKKRALLVIDVQNDFCKGGSLAVPDGDSVVPVANALINRGGYDIIVLSQDWHPKGHGSFASQHPGKNPFDMGELAGKPQVMWPDHCVQGSKGAEFHPKLFAMLADFVQQKGTDKLVDSYSAFRDNNATALTGLAEYLKAQGIEELDVCGLATDYCVSFSALDAVELLPGVKVNFIEDASRGIDPAGVEEAKKKMQAAGVRAIQSADRLPKAAPKKRNQPKP
jgi:nicotinamidase/pyrazinamidase